MKSKIAPYLRHLLSLADEEKIECLIVVDVQHGTECQPVPTVGAFAENIDREAAGRMTSAMRTIGRELREGLAAGGGAYPPPPQPKADHYFNGRVFTRDEEA